MSDLIKRLRNLNQHGFIKYDDLFIGNEAADELERLTKLNSQKNADEELKEIDRLNHIITLLCMSNQSLQAELAALKAQSTEPVAWIIVGKDGVETLARYESTMLQYEEWGYEITPLYTTPPTAAALVEDFKRRAVEVLRERHNAPLAADIIESLSLINDFNQGETK